MTNNSAGELRYRLGELPFTIRGVGPVFDYLMEEFAALPVSLASEKSMITFELSQTLPLPPVNSISARHYTGWGDGFQVLSGSLRYQLSVIDGSYLVVVQVPLATSGIENPTRYIRKFFNFNYLTEAENLAKNFMYSLFNLLTGQLLVMKGLGVYVHASSFEKNGYGVALIASGGAGKTTSLLKLISMCRFRYLSDDLGLLNSEGELIRTPLRMQVYAYNLRGDKLLRKRFFSSRSILDRLSWRLRLWRKGDAQVRRRVSPEVLFGGAAIAVNAKLRAVIFLERVVSAEFSVTQITQEELIRRLSHIMPGEIGNIDAFSDSLELIGCGGLFLNRIEYSRLASEILAKSLRGLSPVLLKIPQSCNPLDLVDEITRNLETG